MLRIRCSINLTYGYGSYERIVNLNTVQIWLTVESCSNIYQQISALTYLSKPSTCSVSQKDRVVVEALSQPSKKLTDG